MSRHHEFWRTDDKDDDDEEEDATKAKPQVEEEKEYMQVVDEYTVNEEKMWDGYQLF